MKNNHIFPENAQLKNSVEVDPSTPVGNNFARGLSILLRQAGRQTDYVTVMGDLGQAFILQGTEFDDQLTGGYADLGWWPLDRWNIVSRLQFLSWVNGVGLHHHDVDFSGIGPDEEKSFKDLFQATVCEEIINGRALLAFWDFCHVVTGYDAEKPPLLGWDLSGSEAVNQRITHYPCAVTTYGSQYAALDRQLADREALRYAINLGHGDIKFGLWVTGPAAWQGWEEHLLQRKTEHYWHANIRWNLQLQREAVVEYLGSIAVRHMGEVSVHLHQAAEIYRQQLDVVNRMPTSIGIAVPGKEQSELVNLIREAARLDLEAIGSIEAVVHLLSS